MSAKELSGKIVAQAVKNDGFTSLDDTSCCVVYRRTPRNLLICTDLPTIREKIVIWPTVNHFPGKRILCGGTTANIISRELKRPVSVELDSTDKELPPVSHIEGIDLITEGILTLSKVERLLTQGHYKRPYGPAEQIIELLHNSDRIIFVVGTRINTAHQDPNLPVELEIRRNVVKKIKYLLETKYLKDVEISYL